MLSAPLRASRPGGRQGRPLAALATITRHRCSGQTSGGLSTRRGVGWTREEVYRRPIGLSHFREEHSRPHVEPGTQLFDGRLAKSPTPGEDQASHGPIPEQLA